MKTRRLFITPHLIKWSLTLLLFQNNMVGQDFDLPLQQQGAQLGQGILPFDWSGQVGISHHFGFSDLGEDLEVGALILDGSIMSWPYRTAIPFTLNEDISKGNHSKIVYRWGDYSLNEFGVDLITADNKSTSRLTGFKRNFDSQLMGPNQYTAGTIQQNYLFDYRIQPDSTLHWTVGVGYFKTNQSLPVLHLGSWSRGASFKDEVLGVGVVREKTTPSRYSRWQLATSGQRFALISTTDVLSWKADILGYRLRYSSEKTLSQRSSLLVSTDVDFTTIDGNGFTNPTTITAEFLSGIKRDNQQRILLLAGLGFVGPDNYGLNLTSSVTASVRTFIFSVSLHTWLAALPPVMFGSNMGNIASDKFATSQRRTLLKLDIEKKIDDRAQQVTFFASAANPFYYFESLSNDTINLVSSRTDILTGISWSIKQRIFREWYLKLRGTSFTGNPIGWGNGIQHEGYVSLEAREQFFRGNLDIQSRLWLNYWSGRNDYVWDPLQNIGYQKAGTVYNPEATAILNAQFTAIISGFELSYTIVNVFFAARSLVESVLGNFQDEEITLTPSPYYLPPTRMVYLSIRWQFQD